ncbi:hypothetical protein [Bradyrhizobium vignae]|uniref:Uncharacterized protein n=1 Tax=Bradyrhizobium vignae TaxID=1549949 RepID=A0ABS3ZQD1_9BRAD|nr:hypothetical protein [Bradyrhizobium vignae]MBP0110357.1 hypothetical protein [Bradyrhizobium vignae]
MEAWQLPPAFGSKPPCSVALKKVAQGHLKLNAVDAGQRDFDTTIRVNVNASSAKAALAGAALLDFRNNVYRAGLYRGLVD